MTEPGAPARAVFVDPTGRRGRLVTRTCWLLGGLGVAYVAVVLVALLLPPGLSRLTVPGLGAVLPGPAAAPLGAAQGEVRAPDALLAPPSLRPSQSTAPSPRPRPSVVPTQRPVPAVSSPPAPRAAPPGPTSGSTRAPTAAPATSPTAPPTTPATAPPQKATQAPSAPPGSSRAPKARPSPTRGPR